MDEECAIKKNLEIILVKKIEDKEKTQTKSQKKFKRLDIEGINDNNIHKKNNHQEEKEKEFEEFVEEMEEAEIIYIKPKDGKEHIPGLEENNEKSKEKPKNENLEEKKVSETAEK